MDNFIDLHPHMENQPDGRTHYLVAKEDIAAIVIESYPYGEIEVNRIEMHFRSGLASVELVDSPEARKMLGIA